MSEVGWWDRLAWERPGTTATDPVPRHRHRGKSWWRSPATSTSRTAHAVAALAALFVAALLSAIH